MIKVHLYVLKIITMTNVLSEYLKLHNEYSTKYGGRVAVLYQVGHFYESYGIDNGEEKLGNAVELSRILNIVLTRKNKKIVDNGRDNPLMLGFPCLALNKYVPVLLAEDYTVVVADQVKAGAAFRRKVTDVISPSTHIDSAADDNYLVLIHMDQHKHVGMSAISVLTGRSVVHECCHDPDDPDLSADEALAFVKQHRPREVVLSGDVTPSQLELDDVPSQRRPAAKHTVAYQNAVLGCAFENDTMLSNIEYLDLERSPHALAGYVQLIEFVHEHNPMLLRRMSRPETFERRGRLALSTSTLDQMNVTGKSKHTLFNVVNRCITKSGRRLLLKRLTSPSADARELNVMYDQIHEFGVVFGDVDDVEKILKRVDDVERLHRRMTVGVMTPAELSGFVASQRTILELDDLVRTGQTRYLPRMKKRRELDAFLGTFDYAFDADSLSSCDADTVVFNSSVFPELDELRAEMDGHLGAVKRLLDQVSAYGIDGARIEELPGTGRCVVVSSMRSKKITDDSGLIVRQNKYTARVTSPAVETANAELQSVVEKLKDRTKKRYSRTLEYMSRSGCALRDAARFASEMDVTVSNFRTSKLYDYCRPVVSPEGDGFVDAKDLRHAVVERIDDGNEYVPNDVALDGSGIVLYSMNSCGKTTLLRALGLSVILAQAGCYVPASSYRMRPFSCMMTRILSRDNIMKGQSSFVAEMSELRAVLKRAGGPRALVLADEITHGTEHTSGSAIFVSAVETLARRRVNFLLTTHLHGAYPFIRRVPNVRTCHLSVTFRANGVKSITFERKLMEGPGGSVYGLEVCEYLDMDADFLARAFQIRDKVTPEKEEARSTVIKVSKYNRNKIMRKCESCNYAPRLPTDKPLHTHHIKERHLADANGMIDGLHVDSVSNLAVLCERCHRQTHAN
jgi:DNA mismatch repair protein MutS